LSVSDKTGVVSFAKGLIQAGFTLLSTGGTKQTLVDAGLAVTGVEEITGFPEMLDGRVKTLHPKIHGGLLAKRENQQHMQALVEQEILPIDLVCVNLYPFEATLLNPAASQNEIIENIDIGGPSMLRSAAKNFAYVTVVVDPQDYAQI